MNTFSVLYDGASRPIIQTPSGKWLSLSAFVDGRWQSYEQEDRDCHTIVDALNWVLIHGPALIQEGQI